MKGEKPEDARAEADRSSACEAMCLTHEYPEPCPVCLIAEWAGVDGENPSTTRRRLAMMATERLRVEAHRFDPATTRWRLAMIAAERLRAEVEDNVARAEKAEAERDEARAEVERLRVLALEMFEHADDWHGLRASSHYRSEIHARLRAEGHHD